MKHYTKDKWCSNENAPGGCPFGNKCMFQHKKPIANTSKDQEKVVEAPTAKHAATSQPTTDDFDDDIIATIVQAAELPEMPTANRVHARLQDSDKYILDSGANVIVLGNPHDPRITERLPDRRVLNTASGKSSCELVRVQSEVGSFIAFVSPGSQDLMAYSTLMKRGIRF